ncbi:hypothetical protein MUK42_21644 [Musa troglodytarum]|uniref:Uncharacterized protein n=1 Tax=Musa troglodytarum TaxID=320322 RepID=A0A9E7GB97_9LILI|nr:hypothetical protein MUK42_21644 [Musa troglodytarum]
MKRTERPHNHGGSIVASRTGYLPAVHCRGLGFRSPKFASSMTKRGVEIGFRNSTESILRQCSTIRRIARSHAKLSDGDIDPTSGN